MWFLWNFKHTHCHKNEGWVRKTLVEYGVKQHKRTDDRREFWEMPILAECSRCGVQFITEKYYDWEMIKEKVDNFYIPRSR